MADLSAARKERNSVRPIPLRATKKRCRTQARFCQTRGSFIIRSSRLKRLFDTLINLADFQDERIYVGIRLAIACRVGREGEA